MFNDKFFDYFQNIRPSRNSFNKSYHSLLKWPSLITWLCLVEWLLWSLQLETIQSLVVCVLSVCLTADSSFNRNQQRVGRESLNCTEMRVGQVTTRHVNLKPSRQKEFLWKMIPYAAPLTFSPHHSTNTKMNRVKWIKNKKYKKKITKKKYKKKIFKKILKTIYKKIYKKNLQNKNLKKKKITNK